MLLLLFFFFSVPEDKPMTEPKFTQNLSDKTVSDGESVTMKCVVSGDPEPQIEWLKDGIVSIYMYIYCLKKDLFDNTLTMEALSI